MKKIYTILAMLCAPFWVSAQCSMAVLTVNCSCYNSCDGQATAQMTGTAPFTYAWMPMGQTTASITNLCEGSYLVEGTDALGCVASQMISITQPPTLNVVFLSYWASCQSCCDGSIQLTVVGGTPPYTYAWSPSGGPGPNSQNLCPGTYSCCVTDANGCQSCSTYTVNFNTGINDVDANGNLSVFPGVASDVVTVKGNLPNASTAQLTVLNMLGEVVYSKSIDAAAALEEQIDVAQYDAGIYFISVTTASGAAVGRFVKE